MIVFQPKQMWISLGEPGVERNTGAEWKSVATLSISKRDTSSSPTTFLLLYRIIRGVHCQCEYIYAVWILSKVNEKTWKFKSFLYDIKTITLYTIPYSKIDHYMFVSMFFWLSKPVVITRVQQTQPSIICTNVYVNGASGHNGIHLIPPLIHFSY